MNRFRWTPEGYPRLTARAQQLASLVTRFPPRADLRALFAPGFLEATPPKALVRRLRDLYRQHGRVVALEPMRVSAENIGMVSFLTERWFRLRVVITLELEETGRIAEFSSQADQLEADFPSVLERVKELPGSAGLALWRLAPGGPQEILAWEPERALSVGSAYKLYVLGALLDSGLPLETEVVLRDQARAFPSGFLHLWPEGAPLTLLTLATLMISISDNTATELLMQHLGREAVEAAVARMGHSRPEQLSPFLSSLDMVRLKGDSSGQRGRRYQSLDGSARRAMLAELAGLPRASVGISPAPRNLELGWWASPADLCRAWAWIWARGRADARVRELVSVNSGILTSLPFSGFKGGGDAGVVAASFLLEDHGGSVYALATAWNNPQNSVTESRLFNLLESLMWCLPDQHLKVRASALRPLPRPPEPTLWERVFG